MASFAFHPLSRFAGTSTTIRRPREFTFFSFDDEHKLHPISTRSLNYYYPPFFDTPGINVQPLDLSEGFASFVQRDDSVDEHLDALLDTLQMHEERHEKNLRSLNNESNLENVPTKPDIITWRGMMTKILVAPFDHFSEFEMNATYFQGTIFIEEDNHAKVARKLADHARKPKSGALSQELMAFWGYKFETLSVLPRPWAECTRDEIEARPVQVVNNNGQYCSIINTTIGSTSLVIAGEVDCVLGNKPDSEDDPIPWVELKTTAEPGNRPEDRLKFERKLLRFWAQSFLLGVPTIVLGFRTQNGLLTRIKELPTQRLPSMVKQSTQSWDGNVCINFTAAFLDFLRKTISGKEGVWKIKKRMGEKVINVYKIEEAGTGKILTSNFKAHRERLASKIVG